MTLLFDIIFMIYALVSLPFVVLQGKLHEGFGIRFGEIPEDIKRFLSNTKNIWVHAVSVGEVVAIDTIIQELKKEYPSYYIVVTVTTKTGYFLASKKYIGDKMIKVLWSPVDLSFVVKKFIEVIHPVFYVVAETEIWPNLFKKLFDQRIPIFLLNGRISDAAYPFYQSVRFILKETLEQVTFFCMQSTIDAERMISLGAPAHKVVTCGNIKFDAMIAQSHSQKKDFGLEDDSFVLVAGSTHQGEEDEFLSIYQALRAQRPSLRLILAPRHPERARKIFSLVHHYGLTPVLFSLGVPKTLQPHEVLIIDVIGKLIDVYSLADLVFVGKSLTQKGGHNIIEPAVFSKPVLIGPYMDNFKDITNIFLKKHAVCQVKNDKELLNKVKMFIDNSFERETLGRWAKGVVEENKGASKRMIQYIQANIKC